MNPEGNAEKTVWSLHERPYRYNTGCMREIRYYRMRDNEMVMT